MCGLMPKKNLHMSRRLNERNIQISQSDSLTDNRKKGRMIPPQQCRIILKNKPNLQPHCNLEKFVVSSKKKEKRQKARNGKPLVFSSCK